MKHGLMALALLGLLALPSLADDIDDLPNPLRDAAVGEWASYTMTYDSPMGGPGQEMPIRMEVVGIDGDIVEIKSLLEVMGVPQETTQSLDRTKSMLELIEENAGGGAMGGQQLTNLEVLSTSVEDSEFERDGKTHATKKITIEFTAEFSMGGGPGMPIEMTMVRQVSDSIPVEGTLHEEISVKISMGGPEPMVMKATRKLVDFGGGDVLTDEK
jgi:hypothetical protein